MSENQNPIYNAQIPNYGYQYPMGYPQQRPQPIINNMPMPMVWIDGEEEAKRYSVAPNLTIPLWDKNNPIIYLKSTDSAGMASMKIIDYSVREQQNKNEEKEPNIEYVSKEDFKSFEERIQKQLDRLLNANETGNKRYSKESGKNG